MQNEEMQHEEVQDMMSMKKDPDYLPDGESCIKYLNNKFDFKI